MKALSESIPNSGAQKFSVSLRSRNRKTTFAGRRLDASQLQRWATRGCRLVADGPHYLFPSIRGSRERLTCRSWAVRWASFVALTQQQDADRQVAARDLAKVDRRAKAAMERYEAVNGTRS